MATDVERLVVSLEASITKYERAMQRAVGVTNQTAARVENRFAQTNKRIAAQFAAIGPSIQSGLAKAFAGAAALRGAQQLIDASIGISNSLKISGVEGERLAVVYDSLFASAQRNAAPLENLATLYGRAAAVQKELGASSQELLKFTDNIAMALRVQGGDAAQAQGALLQLGQALGSARVMAEEFNSINEGARPILQAAAAGINEAGGSVAKLKQLVVDGKISNQAFFQGIQAGSVILEDKLVNAELSVSQSFTRLRNVLIDVAGDFNTGTGASDSFSRSLDQLGNAIENLSDNERFLNFLAMVNDFGNQQFDNTSREFQQIGEAVDGVRRAFADTNAEVDRTLFAANGAQSALEAFAIANSDVFSPEVEAAFRDLITQLVEGKGNADKATEAIMAMGAADPNFDKVIGKVDILVATFIRLRDAADAALRSATQAPVPTNGGFAGQETAPSQVASTVKPITAADYPVIGSKGAGGSGKKTPVQRFDEELAEMKMRTQQLRDETAAREALNPLVNDYGLVIERLRAQQDLENAATKAGIALTPERTAQIAALAEGYATATVEAAKLAEAQDATVQQMEDLRDASRQALDTIIDGFLEGKDAGEIFGNVLKDIASQLISMGLNSAFGTGSGANPFGFIGKAFGFATGGIAKNGKPMKTFARGGVSDTAAIFGEGPMAEAAVPLPDGRRIPVDLRMPTIPSAGGMGNFSMPVTIVAPGADAEGLDRLTVEVFKLRAAVPTMAKKAYQDMRKYGQMK